MKRSSGPIYWLLFGAGGMLSALVAPGVIVALMSGQLGYAEVLAVAKNGLGKAFLFAIASLFLWHAAHRIYHMLHDLGFRTGAGSWLLSYGVALGGTIAAALSLLKIGF